MKSVLIVDDDVKLCLALHEYLARHGITVSIQHDGLGGLQDIRAHSYDLLLLDAALPDVDDFEVLKQLRRFSDLPVLLFSTQAEVSHRIHGLQLGADDYLTKPFDPKELVARINAILRRKLRTSDRNPQANRTLIYGDLTLDVMARSASCKSLQLELTDIEFALMEKFVRHPGVVISREELSSSIFEQPFHPLNRSLDMHVCRLRKKLAALPPIRASIKTVRSVGYLLSGL